MGNWRIIPKHPSYEASDDGRVRRLLSQREMAQWQSNNGYMNVTLSEGGRKKNRSVHRLVALAWLEPGRPEQCDVNHKDSDRTHNHATNLEWSTRSENLRHGYASGFCDMRGEKHSQNILTEKDVREIKSAFTGRFGQKAEMARQYGVDHGTIRAVLDGRSWKHVK